MIQQQQLQAQQLAEQQLAQQEAVASAQRKQSIFQVVFGFCSQMFRGSPQTAMGSQGKSLTDSAYDVEEAAYKAIENQGFHYESTYKRETVNRVGSEASAAIITDTTKACERFINKEGQLGDYGTYALSQIRSKPNSFADKIPSDISGYCPNYASMNKEERELYWVWILMSMAASESSCIPTNDNPNAPNGTAVGLFQVWKPVCPKARDLHKPNENIQCAVDLLAKEMENRDALKTPTSRGKEGTYWGPLRNDDWNTARGGDISGAQKTSALMKKYPYCTKK